MTKGDRVVYLLLLFGILGGVLYNSMVSLETNSAMRQNNDLLQQVIVELNRMATFTATWTAVDGITYNVSVTQKQNQSPEEAEAIFDARLASQLLKHPRAS